jgi:hypothetical protein
MALRTGRTGPASTTKLSWNYGASCGIKMTNVIGARLTSVSFRNELSTQNWSGQGDSDSLIKTKHCDGPKGC